MRDCPSIKDLEGKGILVRKEGTNQLMLKDGGYLPRDDDTSSRKEKVLRIVKERGWLNESPSSFFWEEPEPDADSVFYQEPEAGPSTGSRKPDDVSELARYMYRVFSNEQTENDRAIELDVAEARSKNY